MADDERLSTDVERDDTGTRVHDTVTEDGAHEAGETEQVTARSGARAWA